MSIFTEIMNERAEERAKADEAARQAQELKASKDAEFIEKFNSHIDTIAKPIFGEFVADAIAHNFPAAIEENKDGYGHPYISLRFIPEEGKELGRVPTSECSYVIKAILHSRQVEHNIYYDQRPGVNGFKKESFGVQSISMQMVERKLRELFSLALKSRE